MLVEKTEKEIKKVCVLEEIENTPHYDSLWRIEVTTSDNKVMEMYFTYYDVSEEYVIELLRNCKTITDILELDRKGKIYYD